MEAFLKQVADHYIKEEDFSDIEFIFPNRRSSVFFRKYVCEAAQRSGKALVMPGCTTINELFSSLSDLQPASRISLLVDLYECYRNCYPGAESLDEFICWGDVLIADFNDVDKYLADPGQVFANVRDLRSIEDTFEYLTDSQKEAIKSFLSHFYEKRTGSAAQFAVRGEIKQEFIKLWNILLPLYESFNRMLDEKGLGYEGKIYRKVAAMPESVENHLEGRRFVFVGLNALNECEKKLLRHLQGKSAARFCWDWSGEWIKDSSNRASLFMSANVKEFGQDFPLDVGGLPNPHFNVVSVPSAVGQAKQLPYILGQIMPDVAAGEDGVAAEDCAIVLPDESLLLSVLNSIPPEVKDVNVTMGYPMRGSDFAVLLSTLSAARMNVVRKGESVLFYHKYVRTVLSSNIFRTVASESDSKVCEKILADRKLYVPAEDFAGSELLSLWFRPSPFDPTTASVEAVREFARYQKEVIDRTGGLLSVSTDSGMETLFAKTCYNAVASLEQMNLDIKPSTWMKLLDQILQPVSVPFAGEPLKGLQVMGPLESRALDFRNLVILSCNEGVFPRKSFSSSFIPPELRKGFGLPTYEYQDAVWAYYFYRLIQRAENVWLLYDSRSDGVKTGEESRYIKQLDYLYNADITRCVTKLSAGGNYDVPPIVKTREHLDRINAEVNFSASLLRNYLSCPAKFYYSKIEGLKDVQDSADDLDGGTFGNVFHNVMRWIYCKDGDIRIPVGRVDGAWLKFRLSPEFAPSLRSRIAAEICAELRTDQVRGKNLVLAEVIEQYVLKTLEYDLKLLKSRNAGYFTVLGIERSLPFVFAGHRFAGFIDRLDSFSDGEIRIVDYKTGKVSDKEMMVMGESGDDE
ncbi:MAG: PD-(D/E)XK nuclease family protein, partial [Candidatus Cryptobacteroides sp.]